MVYDSMYEMKCNNNKIIIMVPYPAQGHVTPMLKLASSLTTFGFQPLIILPEFLHRSMVTKVNIASKGRIVCVSIPDGLDETKPRDFFAIEKAMEDHMPAHLERWMRKLNGGEGEGVACMIVDLLASWAIDVGRECNVTIAGFWPAMLATYCLISSIPNLVHRGIITDSGLPQLQGHISFEHNQPRLDVEDLPWLIGTQAAKKARFKFWARTMDRSRSLRCILVNSFPGEPRSTINTYKWASSPRCGPNVYPIGPLKSKEFLESPTFWEEDTSCLGWLDKQKTNSVMYISFGSWVSPIGETKVRSLALALEELRRPFIWVLGPTWRDGLPNGYLGRIGEFGKIVAWAPQEDVLQHKAVGGYLTHCGWNSTLEAIQCKKCLLCFPVAGDQFLNCEYIVNVWKIGVKMNGFSFKDVNDGISKVMEDRSMKKKIEELNEKITGDEAILNMKNNMLHFLNDIKKPLNEVNLNI